MQTCWSLRASALKGTASLDVTIETTGSAASVGTVLAPDLCKLGYICP
jgi:hypothetical protein